MKVTLKRKKSCNPKTYYQFTLIDLQFINTFQGWSINVTFCNIFLQILHEKKRLLVSHSFTPEYKIGDKLTLDMGDNTVEEVTVTEITPHDCVPNSVYYTFSNGVVCRDIRLH